MVYMERSEDNFRELFVACGHVESGSFTVSATAEPTAGNSPVSISHLAIAGVLECSALGK